MNPTESSVRYNDLLATSPLVATYIDYSLCLGLPKYLETWKSPIRVDIGLNTPVPIKHLCVNDEGIKCTLSFQRQPYPVVIPWAAVYDFLDSTEADTKFVQGYRYPDPPADMKLEDKGRGKVMAREGNVVRVRFGA